MANYNQVNTRFITRNDTFENWEKSELVLLKGEMAVDLDNNKIKIGDGIHTFKELPYSGLSASDIPKTTHTSIIVESTDVRTDNVILVEDIENPIQGDLVTIIRAIAIGSDGTVKNSYTGYVYNGTGWAAMDGNYNAENVYFDENIAITTAVGNITLTNGQGSIPAQGKNLKQVFESIWTKEDKEPDATNPSCTISMNGYTSDQNKEVGETIDIAYTTSFSAGSYQYGPATGIVAGTYTVSNGSDTLNTNTGNFDTITMADANDATKDQYKEYRLSVTVAYDGSEVYANTNLGNVSSVIIGDGDTTKSYSKYIKSYRKPFWGYKTTSDLELEANANLKVDPTKITSAQARALQKNGTSTGGVPSTYTVPANTKQVYFLVKAGTKTSLSVKNESSLNAPVAFTKVASGVQVEGANGFAATAYDLWYANFDNATTGEAKLNLTWA